MPRPPDPIAALPGATWRPLSLDDVDAYLELLGAARVADGGPEVTTAEVARHDLSDPNCPLPTNSLALALPDGSLSAVLMVRERLQGLASRRVFLWGVTHPAHRRRGVGRAVLDWGLDRADEILAAQPVELERLVETFTEERLADAVALHESAGFRAARWYVDMRRDLHDPLPDERALGGIRIERYEAMLGERVRAAHNEAFADHWASEPLTKPVWNRDFVGDPNFRDDLSFVAHAGAEVAGYTLNYVYEADWEASGVREGWVGQLGVRRPWRGRGLATALLARSMAAFLAAGMDAAILGVDVENPTGALGVYERAGFRAVRRYVRLQRRYQPQGK